MAYKTGSIIPLGDGATGKSALTSVLTRRGIVPQEAENVLAGLKKSVNIEIEFVSVEGEVDGQVTKASCQYYVFPGQRQKTGVYIPTFEEILEIFQFLPMLKSVNVLLLVWDTTRIESLKSLESWLQVALSKNWVSEDTLLILISNKIDLQDSNDRFVDSVVGGITRMVKANGVQLPAGQVRSISTSCMDLQGIAELRSMIDDWILTRGVAK